MDALFPMVTARGASTACDYYQALLGEYQNLPVAQSCGRARLLWHGYPMWFLPTRFPRCFDEQFRVVLDDYTLWWDLRYGDHNDAMDALIGAYSSTYLNRTIREKIDWVCALVEKYAIDGVIFHANRSCRRSLADIVPIRDSLSERGIQSVIIESDMANPADYASRQVTLRIESFREMLES